MICGTRSSLLFPQGFLRRQYHWSSFHLQLHVNARGQFARPQLRIAAQRFPLRAARLVHQELVAADIAANAVFTVLQGRLVAQVIGEGQQAIALVIQFAVIARHAQRQHRAGHHDADDQHHHEYLDQREASARSDTTGRDSSSRYPHWPSRRRPGRRHPACRYRTRHGYRDFRRDSRGPRDPCSGA